MAERRILSKDFDEIERFINDEVESRERNAFRKQHESRWKEIDRQIQMEAIKRRSIDGRPLPKTWHNEFELGELTKASEIITADAMRMLFPDDRAWFEPHVQIEGRMDPQTGRVLVDADTQEIADDRLRALMSQQHLDFGFKARFELSIKESLHHGSMGVEIRWEPMLLAQGGSLRNVAAPVWVPYSMWNTFPDPSPSVVGTNMFYPGSMIFVEYMPLWKLKRIAKGEGWLPKRLEQVNEKQTWKLQSQEDADTNDVKLCKYFGDLSISRKKGEDIFLPNCEAILANNKLVFVKANEDTPYPRVIFAGYERPDVRNPYYTSPIIKNSPIQKFTTLALNRFADVADLYADPPIEYDGNDPDYAASGGPRIAPGAKNPTKSMGKGFKTLEIGDPRFLLEGGQMGIRMLEQGTGVSALRQGSSSSDRQTATEIRTLEQGAEVRTVDFVSKLGPQALRPFLYMQHDLNRQRLSDYPVYVNEMKSPDFMFFTRDMVDVNANFDVVGARSMLGEERRKQQMTQVTFAAAGNPLFAPLLNAELILMDMYRDAGKKNPEEWIKPGNGMNPVQAQQIQQLTQALQQLGKEHESMKADKSLEANELQMKGQIEQQKLALESAVKQKELELKEEDMATNAAIEAAKLVLKEMELRMQSMAEQQTRYMEAAKQANDQMLARTEVMMKAIESAANRPVVVSSPKRRKKITYNAEGDITSVEDEDVQENRLQ